MRGLISAAVTGVAIVLQLAVVDRMALPGGAGPSLVLVTVAALALATGPMTGMLAGFAAGLALDIAPPAGHLVGEDALVFCLIGYACGLATGLGGEGTAEQEHSALFELGVTAVGAVCGEALIAALGVMLSDPRVTWSAVKHVLPFAICYDLMLSPFVLLAVAATLRLAGTQRAKASQRAPGPARRSWTASPAAAGAVRQMAGGKSPQLRLGGQQKPHAPRPAALGSAPKLRFGTNVGAALLGGSVFARTGTDPAAALAKGRVKFRRGALARSATATRRNRPPAGTHTPRFRKPGLLARFGAVLRRPPRSRTPGRGWASNSGRRWTAGAPRGVTGRRPGKGWIRAAKPVSRVRTRRPARLRMRSRYRTGLGIRNGIGASRPGWPRKRKRGFR